jgi:hypothetical protein
LAAWGTRVKAGLPDFSWYVPTYNIPKQGKYSKGPHAITNCIKTKK